MKSNRFFVIFASLSLILFSSCISDSFIIGKMADALGSGAEVVFSSDNDPVLIGDALPFTIKLYEIMLNSSPENDSLALQTGSLIIMYSMAYVQLPAEMLPIEAYEEKQAMLARADSLYNRAADYIMRAMSLRYPGFSLDAAPAEIDNIIAQTGTQDVALLYWAAAVLMARFSLNPLDIALGHARYAALSMMERAYALDPDYGICSIDEFFIAYYSGLPASMGGDPEKARYYFYKAVEKSGDTSISAYISLAEGVSIAEGNRQEYIELLERALAIDPKERVEARLTTLIYREKVQFLLNNVDNNFLPEEEEF